MEGPIFKASLAVFAAIGARRNRVRDISLSDNCTPRCPAAPRCHRHHLDLSDQSPCLQGVVLGQGVLANAD